MLRTLLRQWKLPFRLLSLCSALVWLHQESDFSKAPTWKRMTAGSTEDIVSVSLTELGLDLDSYFIGLGKIFNLCKPQLLSNTCLSTEKSLRTG